MIPEYMHRAIAANTADEQVRERALVSLALSHAQRSRRARQAPTQELSPPLRALLLQLLAWLEGGWGKSPPVPRVPQSPGPDRTVLNGEHDRVPFNDQVVLREGSPTDAADDAASGAYTGLGDMWGFLWDTFGRDSLDGEGMPLRGVVHYASQFDNAFYSAEDNEMSFGDGDGTVFARGGFTSPDNLDVPAHELMHGVTAHTANLAYTNQAGGLNESISDVFGICCKYQAHGVDVSQANWIIGEHILAPGINGRGLRDMMNPGTAYDDPVLGRDLQYGDMSDYRDGDDPHITSGIPNRAFALAASTAGGNPWGTVLPAWYAALTSGRVSPGATFAEFARATVDEGGDYSGVLVHAWQEVGVLR